MTTSPIPTAPQAVAIEPPQRLEPALQFLALLLIIAAQIACFWSLKYFPTTDGPSHLANARIIQSYYLPSGQVYHPFYEIQKKPMTNIMGHCILALLLFIAPATVAEKILLTAYAVLAPLSAFYAARGVNRRAGFAAILATPFFFGYLFHMGFYNFILSVIPFFLLIGYWLRHREKLTLPRAAMLTLLSLLVYFCHIFALTIACIFIVVMSVWLALVDITTSRQQGRVDWRSVSARFASRAMVALYALLPAILLTLNFTQGRASNGAPSDYKKPHALLNLLQMKELPSYTNHEEWCGSGLAVLWGLALLGIFFDKIRRRRWVAMDGLLLVPVVLVGLLIRFNDFAHGVFFFPERLSLFAVFTLVLWIAAQPMPRWVWRPLWMGTTLLALALVGVRIPAYQALERQLDTYMNVASAVPAGSTLLPLINAPDGSPPLADRCDPDVRPFFHPSSYVDAQKPLIDLRNYEANEVYFPVRFRDEANPYKHLALPHGFDQVPQAFNIAAYEKQIGRTVDYVLMWGSPSAEAGNWYVRGWGIARIRAGMARIRAQLDAGYELVTSSGSAELWKRKSH